MAKKHAFHIEITNKCIIECSNCPRTWLKQKFPKIKQVDEMDIDMLCNFLEGVTEEVHFEGNTGDVIYHSKFLELVEKIKKMQIRIIITTNGSGKRISFWKSLIDLLSPTDTIMFSVDGLEDTNHIYRKNSKWNTILPAIKLVGESDLQSVWKFIVFKHNEHQIEEARNFSKKLGIDTFKLVKSNRNWSPDYPTELIPSKEYHDDLVEPRGDLLHGKQPTGMNPQCLKKGKGKMDAFISVFGDYYPCCYMGSHNYQYKSIWNPKLQTFNIKHKRIKDILQNKLVMDFYKSTKSLQTASRCCKIYCGEINGRL